MLIKNLFLIIVFSLLAIFPLKAFADNFQSGVSAYNSGNYNDAESLFAKALKADPDNDVIKYYLAISLVRNRKLSQARVFYTDIIETSLDENVINYARQGLSLIESSPSKVYKNSGKIKKTTVNINTVGNIILVDDIYINDSVKVKFIFDTGASYTTISSKLADRLGISTSNAKKLKIMTGSGYIYAPKIIIKKIDINGLCAYNVEALVADLPVHVSGTGADLAGLLGISFIKDFKVTVDKAHGQIVLEKN